MTQILIGVDFMHQRKTMHRDIKDDNIFLHKNERNQIVVKIGDFGISRAFTASKEFAVSMYGSPRYMSPQMLRNEQYSLKYDIWALGVLFYYMISGHYPYEKKKLVFRELPPLQNRFDDSVLVDVVVKMLSQQEEERPTAA